MAEPDKKIVISPSETQEAFIRSTVLENCAVGPRGEGKCLRKGTRVLMYDGTILRVEEIKTGDLLMGDDSTPREITSTTSGVDQLFAVVPGKGDSFVVNSKHILCFQERKYIARRVKGDKKKRIKEKKPYQVREISVLEYMVLPNHQKNNLCLYRTGVEWTEKPMKISPYLMGLWLGDGSSYRPAITTGDKEIVDFLKSHIPSMGLKILEDPQKGNCCTYLFSGGKLKRNHKSQFRPSENPFSQAIYHDYDLYKNKHIPYAYKCNSRENRLKLLAGIIDTDGWVNHGGYGVIVKQKRLADDIAFIARSLCFAAYVTETRKQIKARNFEGTYYLVYISGDCSIIPVRIPRKKVPPRRQIKNVLHTQIKEVVQLPFDEEYYGFTLSGNGRFLLGDFTVTHNSDAGIMAMTYHAKLTDMRYRPVPWAIVRDTWKNIERTTYRSLMFPTVESSLAYQLRGRIKQKDGGRHLWLTGDNGGKVWEAFLFGMDTPEDLNQLLSMQLGGLWVEEAAPAMQEEIGKGISEEVWTLGITSLRHPIMSDKATEFLKQFDGNVKKMSVSELKEAVLLGAVVRSPYGDFVPRNRRAQITMNYPSEDHWTWVRFFEEGGPDRALFQFKAGENPYIDTTYRENMMRSLAGREDLLDRLVRGRPAHVQIGIAVTPEYHDQLNGGPWHRANIDYSPMIGLPVFRFWDGDLHPACFFAQITPRGKFMGLDTVRAPQTGMGMKQFIDQYVKPLLANRYSKVRQWRDLGDPTLNDRDPSDSSKTAAQMIERELNTTYEGGVLRWEPRKEALKDLLTRTLSDGEPMFTLSKHEKIMHRSLSGGWHYRKSSTGKVSTEPNNDDINSHPAAALSHGLAKIFKYERESRMRLPAPRKRVAVASSVQPLHMSR